MKNTAQLSALFQTVKSFILLALVFLVPLFFLPITQEFFVTNKLYLLAFGSALLVAISTIEFLITKKLVWVRGMFDSVAILFVFALALSILLSSPNKVQAVLNPNFGLAVLLSLTVFYFYLARHFKKTLDVLSISALVVAVIALVFFLNPLKSVNLPSSLGFLKTEGFNTLGGILDLALFLGFFVALQIGKIVSRKNGDESNGSAKALLPSILTLVVTGTALAVSIFMIVKPSAGSQNALIFPPLSVSWYAAVEILKNPISALFGVGVDNFSSIFAGVKDAAYNASPLWQIQSFNASRSTVLHILAEVGIFGIVAFGLLLLSLIREVMQKAKQHPNTTSYLFGVGYLVAAAVLFPPSFIIFFLLFVMLAVIAQGRSTDINTTNVNLSNLLPVYLGTAIIAFVIVGGASYLLSRTYMAEYSYKSALNGIAANNIQVLYENQRQAIVLNPYIERFRVNFAQTNLLIANNIAQKAQQSAGNATEGSVANAGQQAQAQLSDQDKQTITQAIQASIAEAKAAAALNPAKAVNWENLANIYRNVLFVAQGADNWTISAYQRAIVLDPQNPMYRISLGGVFFSLQNYDEAAKMFEQATALKPDWSNAHYNLAWALSKKGDAQRAVNEMQSVLSLLDPKKDEADFKKAQQDLEELKKLLPKQEESASTGEAEQPQQLSLPTPPAANVDPKLPLPKEAGPEAK